MNQTQNNQFSDIGIATASFDRGILSLGLWIITLGYIIFEPLVFIFSCGKHSFFNFSSVEFKLEFERINFFFKIYPLAPSKKRGYT